MMREVKYILALLLLSAGFCRLAYSCEPLVDIPIPETANYAKAEQELGNWMSLQAYSNSQNFDKQQQAKNVECYLRQQAEQFEFLAAPAEQLAKLANNAFSANTTDQKRTAIAAITQSVNQDAGTGFLQLPSTDTSTIELDLFADVLQSNCSEQTSSDCSTALSLASNLWWISSFYRDLASDLNKDEIAASLEFNDRLDRMWRSYKDDTILLWPQEVLLNSLVYKPSQQGLNEPPSYKLLSLRPSLGLSYFSDQDDHILPSLNVDLLGMYWWHYGGADGTTAQPGRGLAASVIWDGSDTALGLTYHHNPKWSATIAHGDKNDLVVSISFQLGYWLLGR